MESLGSFLVSKRKEKRLSLEDVHKKTKISLFYLQALDANDFSVFHGEPYLKGFLRAYAKLLELDPKIILEKYEASRGPEGQQRQAVEVVKDSGDIAELDEKEVRFLEKIKAQWLKWSLLVIGALVAAYLVAVLSNLDKSKDATKSFAKNLAESRQIIGLKDDNVYLLGVATADTWLMVSPDNAPAKNRLLNKGDYRVWKAKKKFFIKIGNAAGMNFMLNNKPLGVLGREGQVVNLVVDATGKISYGAAEDLTATAKIESIPNVNIHDPTKLK